MALLREFSTSALWNEVQHAHMSSRHIPPAFERRASELDAMLSEMKSAAAPDSARFKSCTLKSVKGLELRPPKQRVGTRWCRNVRNNLSPRG